MGISNAERLRRKREAERKRQKRIYKDPDRLTELNRKRRARYALKQENRKGKKESKKVIAARREKWRIAKQKQNERKKLQQVQDEEFGVIPRESNRAKSMKKKAKQRSEAKRLQNRRQILQLSTEVRVLKRRVEKYRKRCHRLEKKAKNTESPRCTLEQELRGSRISPKVRRKLLFVTAITSDLRESYSKMKSKKEKRQFADRIHFNFVKKYRFLSSPKPFFVLEKRNRVRGGARRKQTETVKQIVREYFLDDSVSCPSPNKNDVIVRKKVKKEKRFLQNSLKYLFMEFCEKKPFVISYSAFCKLRPFWVINRNISARDTTFCIKCENCKLLCKHLHRLKVLATANIDEFIKAEMCCSKRTEAWFFRKCTACERKTITFDNPYLDGNEEFHYEAWGKCEDKGRDGKVYVRTAKIKIQSQFHEMVSKFDRMLFPYMAHVGNIRHQNAFITKLRENLSEDELLVHIDFSENYMCKYGSEIQSVHFGGNRTQITLHTGVLYSASLKHAFCTISPDLRHGPVEIFMHLKPILQKYKKMKTIHFLSDSPSSQYRNKYMFYILIKHIVPLFEALERLTYNFSEAGHGKGAADGVGGTVKRTCDRIISYNKDISTFDQFAAVVQNEIKGIQIVSVDARNEELKEEVYKNALSVKGTLFLFL